MLCAFYDFLRSFKFSINKDKLKITRSDNITMICDDSICDNIDNQIADCYAYLYSYERT